jgi:serine/threonine-protein kinase
VKPANIMLSTDGELKLVDFGIAKDTTADDLTREGVVVGSPAYMPPEVMNGVEADAKADIWALGVTLYELCAARRPFMAATTESLVQAVRGGSFPRLRSLAPGVPRRLARAIERCLRKRPRDRWTDAGALAAELERCAVQSLRGLSPRARLVGLLTHRGFLAQEEALTRVDSKSLLASLVIDEATVLVEPTPRRPRWRWVLLLLLAAGAGAAAAWARYRGLL